MVTDGYCMMVIILLNTIFHNIKFMYGKQYYINIVLKYIVKVQT